MHVARYHNYNKKSRHEFMQDFEKFLLHTLSSFQGEELLRLEGYASQEEFARCLKGQPGSLGNSSMIQKPCLDEEAKLEILERRIRSLEHLFNEPPQMWKVTFRGNSAKTASCNKHPQAPRS